MYRLDTVLIVVGIGTYRCAFDTSVDVVDMTQFQVIMLFRVIYVRIIHP